MKIWILRHGHPDYSNDCLTERGRREAAALAARMAGCTLDQVISSPSGRARETAEATATLTGHTVVLEDALREAEYKIKVQGSDTYQDIRTPVLNDELRQADPVRCYELLDEKVDLQGMASYGTMDVFMSSLRDFLDPLTAHYGFERDGRLYRVTAPHDGSVALFGHGNRGIAIVAYLLSLPLALAWKGLRMDTAGVTEIELKGQTGERIMPVCYTLSDTSHLSFLA